VSQHMPPSMATQCAEVLQHLSAAIALLARPEAEISPRFCRRCHKPYVWTAEEQQYFAEQHYLPPRHCPDCRAQNRKIREQLGRPVKFPWKASGT
jgi:hypothetical protein